MFRKKIAAGNHVHSVQVPLRTHLSHRKEARTAVPSEVRRLCSTPSATYTGDSGILARAVDEST